MDVEDVVGKLNGVKDVEGVGVKEVDRWCLVSLGSPVKKNYEYWKLCIDVGTVPVHEGEEDSK